MYKIYAQTWMSLLHIQFVVQMMWIPRFITTTVRIIANDRFLREHCMMHLVCAMDIKWLMHAALTLYKPTFIIAFKDIINGTWELRISMSHCSWWLFLLSLFSHRFLSSVSKLDIAIDNVPLILLQLQFIVMLTRRQTAHVRHTWALSVHTYERDKGK